MFPNRIATSHSRLAAAVTPATPPMAATQPARRATKASGHQGSGYLYGGAVGSLATPPPGGDSPDRHMHLHPLAHQSTHTVNFPHEHP